MDDLRARAREDLRAHVLGRDRTWLIAHPDAVLTAAQEARIADLLARLDRGEPLAYLLGEQWFAGRPFTVSRDVLIPRPETELLVERALAHLRSTPDDGALARVVDVGTGSGCIAVTVAAELPDVRVIAVDTSEEALAVARVNAKRHGVADRVACVHGTLLEELLRAPALHPALCVLANPPYLTTAEWEGLPHALKNFEPRLAFDGGADGLDPYRVLLAQIATLTRTRCPHLSAFIEIDPRRQRALEALVHGLLPDVQAHIHRDLAGHARILALTPPGMDR